MGKWGGGGQKTPSAREKYFSTFAAHAGAQALLEAAVLAAQSVAMDDVTDAVTKARESRVAIFGAPNEETLQRSETESFTKLTQTGVLFILYYSRRGL